MHKNNGADKAACILYLDLFPYILWKVNAKISKIC